MLRTSFAAFFAVLAVTPVVGLANSITVPLIDKGADTYYVDVHVAGFGRTNYLVDAGAGGAGYMTINKDALTTPCKPMTMPPSSNAYTASWPTVEPLSCRFIASALLILAGIARYMTWRPRYFRAGPAACWV